MAPDEKTREDQLLARLREKNRKPLVFKIRCVNFDDDIEREAEKQNTSRPRGRNNSTENSLLSGPSTRVLGRSDGEQGWWGSEKSWWDDKLGIRNDDVRDFSEEEKDNGDEQCGFEINHLMEKLWMKIRDFINQQMHLIGENGTKNKEFLLYI